MNHVAHRYSAHWLQARHAKSQRRPYVGASIQQTIRLSSPSFGCFAHHFLQSAYQLSQFARCLQAVEADNQCKLDLGTSIQQLLGSFAQPIVDQASQQGATTGNSKYDSATYTATQDSFLYDHVKVQLPYTTQHPADVCVTFLLHCLLVSTQTLCLYEAPRRGRSPKVGCLCLREGPSAVLMTV